MGKRGPTTFELNDNKKRTKKPVRKKKTMKERLPVIIPLSMVAVAAVAIGVYIALTATPVNNSNITAGESQQPVSAEVVSAGFTASAGSSVPTELYRAVIGDKIYAYCQVGALEGETSIAVAWTTPNGEIANGQSIPVTQNGYVYSEMTVEDTGNYTATWTLAAQTPVAMSIPVSETAEAPVVDETPPADAEGAEPAPDGSATPQGEGTETGETMPASAT